jgi:hypothetical protein
MGDLNTRLANAAVTFANMALAADQKAQMFRDIAAWHNQSALSAADRAQALQAENEATFWRLQQEYARNGLLLHDGANPNWSMGEFKDLIAQCARDHRLVNVEYDSAGRLQPTPYAPGVKPSAVAV